MIIRKAIENDIERCVELSKIGEFEIPGGGFPGRTHFEDSLERGIFLVADEEKDVRGLIIGFQLTSELVYLDLLTVDSFYRGRGIGAQLVESFREELIERGVEKCFLIDPNKNPRTLNFYNSRGFKQGGNYTLFFEGINPKP